MATASRRGTSPARIPTDEEMRQPVPESWKKGLSPRALKMLAEAESSAESFDKLRAKLQPHKFLKRRQAARLPFFFVEGAYLRASRYGRQVVLLVRDAEDALWNLGLSITKDEKKSDPRTEWVTHFEQGGKKVGPCRFVATEMASGEYKGQVYYAVVGVADAVPNEIPVSRYDEYEIPEDEAEE